MADVAGTPFARAAQSGCAVLRTALHGGAGGSTDCATNEGQDVKRKKKQNGQLTADQRVLAYIREQEHRQKQFTAKFGHVRIRELSVHEIRPSPENNDLYQPTDSSDPEMKKLAESIRERGVLEPLVVTKDHFILSGHRRFAASQLACASTVPCRVLDIYREVEDENGCVTVSDDFVTMLREYNRQRVKSFDEQLRESVVSATPEEIYQRLIEHRKKKAGVHVNTIEIRGPKERATISDAKRPFCEAITKILEEREDFWPLSDRQIHYALLNDPPLMHAGKTGKAGKKDSTYQNNLKSYKSLVELLTRGRLAGMFPWEAIADETRPVTQWNVWNDVQTFMDSEIKGFLKGYFRNLMRSQPNHIEIVVEKNTVREIVCNVAQDYCIPVTSGRGYCSLPPRYEMAQRFKQSGKEHLVLLIISDFDPDGEEIAHSFARSMRDDFDVSVRALKVALTEQQVEQFQLPPTMEAKDTSTNFARFNSQYGGHAYELEAIQPEHLQGICHEAIDSVIDRKLFNAELDRDKEDAVKLDKTRRRLLAQIGGAA